MSKYYLYNGRKLPALPDIDSSVYPYLLIIGTLPTTLYATKQPSVMKCLTEDNGDIAPWSVTIGEGLEFTLPFGNDPEKWNEPTECEGVNITYTSDAWANHDIIGDKNGVVYIAASEPVPVLEWHDKTPYRRMNGAWVKQDTYKRIGGAWVKQDEYRRE